MLYVYIIMFRLAKFVTTATLLEALHMFGSGIETRIEKGFEKVASKLQQDPSSSSKSLPITQSRTYQVKRSKAPKSSDPKRRLKNASFYFLNFISFLILVFRNMCGFICLSLCQMAELMSSTQLMKKLSSGERVGMMLLIRTAVQQNFSESTLGESHGILGISQLAGFLWSPYLQSIKIGHKLILFNKT